MLELKRADDRASEHSERRTNVTLRLGASPYIQSSQCREREVERIAGFDRSDSDPIGAPADHIRFDRPAHLLLPVPDVRAWNHE
jgi:hypothetical protein